VIRIKTKMVDTHDLFKRLGCGAKFDLKRFKDDADKFKISTRNNTVPSDAVEVLDFFGTKLKNNKSEKITSTSGQNENNIVGETNINCACEENDVSNENKEIKEEKKKKKKRKKSRIEEENSDIEDEITMIKKSSKKKKKKINDNPDRLKEQHIEKINIFRKENQIHVYGSDIPDPIKEFNDLNRRFNVSKQIMNNVTTNSYTSPTPIQMQAIPIMLQNRELLACAPTGSGKTLAFILPLLCQLKESKAEGFRALVVSPTRELAQQIYREFVRLNETLGFRIHLLSKATSNNFNTSSKHKSDILICTPNRLVHLLKEEPSGISLHNVEWLILDEGDKLFEQGEGGFREQVALIYQACDNPSIKRALFSATLANNVEEWCKLHLDNVVRVTVGIKNSATKTIDQELLFVGQESGKLLAIRQTIQRGGFHPPVLVFVQSKERAKELFNELIYDGMNVDVIHSDRTQAQRENVVKSFRSGKTWILISTELMGRGIDFKGVNMVINYDFPPTAVSYIHRIGRTGRAGRQGKAITMFTEEDIPNLRSIANVMKASGCEIPEWMLSIPKQDRRRKTSKVPLQREHIKTVTKYDMDKHRHKKQIIEMTKAKKIAPS